MNQDKIKKITVSAPGKLLLFGEHTVVWGKPCIVTAVDKRVSVEIEKTQDEFIWIEAPEVKVNGYKKPLAKLHNGKSPKEVEFVEEAVKRFFKKFNVGCGLKIITRSEFSSQYGFGSSSAVTACTLFALAGLFDSKLSLGEIFELGYEVILKIQKIGSGFDLAAAIYGGTLYFVRGGKIIIPLKLEDLPLVVGYTGIKADTVTLIRKVEILKNKYPDLISAVFNQIETITTKAKDLLLNKHWQEAGELMNLNHGLLDTLGISSYELSRLVYAARSEGAYGAKLSGAGGGDCMIALVPQDKKEKVELAITKAGGLVISVKNSACGVRVEKKNEKNY